MVFFLGKVIPPGCAGQKCALQSAPTDAHVNSFDECALQFAPTDAHVDSFDECALRTAPTAAPVNSFNECALKIAPTGAPVNSFDERAFAAREAVAGCCSQPFLSLVATVAILNL